MAARALRVVIGLALLLLTAIPVYRILDHEDTGLAGRATVGFADIFFEVSLSGFLLMVPVGILGAVLLRPEVLRRASIRAEQVILSPRTGVWFAACATTGALLTAAFSLLVLEGKPNLVDAFVQLLHARYWAEGILAGPNDGLGAFWAVQNSLFTNNGWVSQYPPGHVALLAPFLRLGVPWLLGPLLVFVAVWSAGALADRLYPDDPVVPRTGAALLALSPFFLFLSGAYMNHATTAACVMAGAWAIVRGWQGKARWMSLAGALLALSLATRPLSTLAMTLAVVLLAPVIWPRSARHLARCVAWGVLGAAPVLALWFAYNLHFFGSPFRLGYNVAHGAGMSLGFHRDPWGNIYGLREAIGYTSSDLVALGTHLFEAPLSATLIVGGYLIAARRLAAGTWLLLGLAIAPVVSNLLYWHHGMFMGPRMLHEAAPAWVLLFTTSAIGLVRRVPSSLSLAGRYHMRPALAAMLVASLAVGLVFMAPSRAMSYGGAWMAIARTPMPEVQGPAIVFVHDAWNARLGMSLAARGKRLDLIETLMRQNPTCRVDEYVRTVVAGDSTRATGLLAELDTIPRANRLPILVEIAPGDGIRIAQGEVLTAACRREALSDRFGIIDISPLLWQAELPGAADDGALVVRDLGPQRNADILARFPEREAYMYVAGNPPEGVRLLPYTEGVRQLWSPHDSVKLQMKLQVPLFEHD